MQRNGLQCPTVHSSRTASRETSTSIAEPAEVVSFASEKSQANTTSNHTFFFFVGLVLPPRRRLVLPLRLPIIPL